MKHKIINKIKTRHLKEEVSSKKDKEISTYARIRGITYIEAKEILLDKSNVIKK